MVEQLFGSKTRVKLLKLFFSNPNRSFYVREITRTVEEQINSVRRELANLLSIGIITSDSTDTNRLYYEVNQKYEHYDSLRRIFSETVDKEEDSEPKAKSSSKATDKKVKAKKEKAKPESAVVETPEAKRWEKVGNVVGVVYSGVYSRDSSAGVDILVVGDVVPSKIDSVIAELEEEKHRELNYAFMSVDEWSYRGQVRDKFWLQLMAAKKQIVLDKENIFVNK